jgi:hypothetical protein
MLLLCLLASSCRLLWLNALALLQRIHVRLQARCEGRSSVLLQSNCGVGISTKQSPCKGTLHSLIA